MFRCGWHLGQYCTAYFHRWKCQRSGWVRRCLDFFFTKLFIVLQMWPLLQTIFLTAKYYTHGSDTCLSINATTKSTICHWLWVVSRTLASVKCELSSSSYSYFSPVFAAQADPSQVACNSAFRRGFTVLKFYFQIWNKCLKHIPIDCSIESTLSFSCFAWNLNLGAAC